MNKNLHEAAPLLILPALAMECVEAGRGSGGGVGDRGQRLDQPVPGWVSLPGVPRGSLPARKTEDSEGEGAGSAKGCGSGGSVEMV